MVLKGIEKITRALIESKALKHLLQKARSLFVFKNPEPTPNPGLLAKRKPTMNESSKNNLTNPNETESGTQLRFWQAVSVGLAEKIGLQTQTPKDRPYLEVTLGRTGFFLSNCLYQGGEMAVRLLLNGDGKEELYQSLLAERKKIERDLGAALTWSDPDEAKKNISLTGPSLSLDDEADFTPAVAWMVEWIAKFKAVFEPRVRSFQPGRGA